MFTNVYVATCGAALTAATYIALGMSARWGAASALVFCCTLGIYNLDRLVEPSPGDSEHERWVARHRLVLWTLACAGSIGAAVAMAWLPMRAILSLIPAAAVALGYCLPVLRWGGRWRRLKQLPGAKLLLIAGVWTYATAGLPMLDAGVAWGAAEGWLLVSRFLFLASVALPFDLPDARRDRLSGIATLPTLLGERTTRAVAVALALLSSVSGLLSAWPGAWALVGSGLIAAAVASQLHNRRGVFYFMVLLDGLLLVQAAGLLLVTSR